MEFPLDTSMFLDNKEHSDEPILALEERRRDEGEKNLVLSVVTPTE